MITWAARAGDVVPAVQLVRARRAAPPKTLADVAERFLTEEGVTQPFEIRQEVDLTAGPPPVPEHEVTPSPGPTTRSPRSR